MATADVRKTFANHKLTLTHATAFVWQCKCGDGGIVHPRDSWDGERTQEEVELRAFAHLGQMLGIDNDEFDHHDGCLCLPLREAEGNDRYHKRCPWHGWED